MVPGCKRIVIICCMGEDQMKRKVTKAVFPVAGLGTRFLPATKANPKEMLPIVDKPLIQYAAEEAETAGIDTLIFVTGRNKRSIPDHFDRAPELETTLREKGKQGTLEVVENILPANISCIYIRQPEALGLGHAVYCARPVVGDEAFAVILADDLIDGEGPSCIAQMCSVFEETGCSILGVQEVPRAQIDQYGVVAGEPLDDERRWNVSGVVEKPSPETAPSQLGIVGRYVLTPRIFELLERTERGKGGEIQLTDAIESLLAYEKVMAYAFEGKRYDCGNKLGYLQATVEMALKHPELGADFADYLQAFRPSVPGEPTA